ncbi:MAG: NRDE family protein [Deltaproteobacteria bacterium]|nr:NRDE family protein [Deltaproteobacteria bacterium]
MCLIVFSYRMHPKYPLVLAANRDEYYERPTAPIAFWDDAPHLLAGRDLREGGTWLGVTKKGRIAALTNYRNPPELKKGAPSRGLLVSSYLCSQEEPLAYLLKLNAEADQYNGFSMIVGDLNHLYYASNWGCTIELMPGLYGLSNRLLDTPWPKVEKGKAALSAILEAADDPHPDDIFQFLSDRTESDDADLPDTGIDRDWERILSAIFITSPNYGTRSSTVIMIDKNNSLTFIEKSFAGADSENWLTTTFKFKLNPAKGNKAKGKNHHKTGC